MRILLVGNHESVFIKNLACYLADNSSTFQVDILSEKNFNEIPLCFKRRQINLFSKDYSYQTFVYKCPKIRGLLHLKDMAKKLITLGHYDVCNLHFASPNYGFISRNFREISDIFIVSVWGSDFYRATSFQKRIQRHLFTNADRITCTNPFMKKALTDELGKDFDPKIDICRFGLSPLKELQLLKDVSKQQAREGFGISKDQIVVTCGYNGSKGQQHIQQIRSIKSVKNLLPDNIFFLFPMTYGAKKEYKYALKTALKELGLPFLILDQFLEDRKVALLRKASDIMIQTQITDQFSGSMQEHLYAGNVVITGDWLPYETLDKKGCFMLKVSDVDQVGEKLVYAINNLDSLKKRCQGNPEIIWELSSWENNIRSWIGMYYELNEKK